MNGDIVIEIFNVWKIFGMYLEVVLLVVWDEGLLKVEVLE